MAVLCLMPGWWILGMIITRLLAPAGEPEHPESAKRQKRVLVIAHVVWNRHADKVDSVEVAQAIGILNRAFLEAPDSSRVRQRFWESIGIPGFGFELREVRYKRTRQKHVLRADLEALKSDREIGSPAVQPRKALNIWVVNYLGFHKQNVRFMEVAHTDGLDQDEHIPGIVIRPDELATSTLIHEVGHFFGLKHPWAYDECGDGDGISDTPECIVPMLDCRTEVNDCGIPQLGENYMDYSPCRVMFTKEQCRVMQRTRRELQ